MATIEGSDALRAAQEYRKLVLLYEALDAEIDKLITLRGGHSENMSTSELEHYRHLARQRDELENAVRAMEQQLLDEE